MVRGTDLKILGLVGSDAGVYQCLATSPAGSIQAAAQLIVKSKGKKVQSRGSSLRRVWPGSKGVSLVSGSMFNSRGVERRVNQ